MLIISHRGNLNGPDPETENTNAQIEKAINAGFFVEVDVWGVKGELWLGHDRPIEPVTFNMTRLKWDDLSKVIYHCKDVHSAEMCGEHGHHFFMHDHDKRALTSEGYFWTFPNQTISEQSIACLPELYPNWDISKAAGICTDYPIIYNDLTTNA